MTRAPHRLTASLVLVMACSLAAWSVPARAAGSHATASRMSEMLAAGKGSPQPPGAQSPGVATACSSDGPDRIYYRKATKAERSAVHEYLVIARQFVKIFEEKLGQPLGIPVCVKWPIKYTSDADADAGVYSKSGGTSGKAAACWIRINPQGTFLGERLGPVLAHEVFHCFQYVIAGIHRIWYPPYGKWVVEGQAEWAAATVAGPETGASGWWEQYLTSPTTPLFQRTYDGIAFYAHLAESGINVWHVVAPMLKSSGDAEAFKRAVYTEGDGQAFLDSWGSSFFQDPGRGKAWDTNGPGKETGEATPGALSVSSGGSAQESEQPYAEGIYVLSGDADIVESRPSGHVRLSDGSVDLVLRGSTFFCLRSDQCQCPKDTYYQGPSLVNLQAGKIDLALTGAEDGAKITLTGHRLDDYCSKRDPCLFGTWRVTDSMSFLTSFNLIVPSVTGTETYTFNKDGTARAEAQSYTIVAQGHNQPGTVSLTLNGSASASDWTTPHKGTLQVAVSGDWTLHIVGGITDASGPTRGNAFSFLGPWGDQSGGSYVCTPTTLQYSPIPGHGAIVMTKVSS